MVSLFLARHDQYFIMFKDSNVFKFTNFPFKAKYNKRNDKRFNNHGYSLFFLMGIFLKRLWLIPNILKWQDCKIFTKLVPSQTLLRSSHRRCSVKKGVFKNLGKFTEKRLCWSLFLIKLQAFRPTTSLNSDSNIDVFLWNLQNF